MIATIHTRNEAGGGPLALLCRAGTIKYQFNATSGTWPIDLRGAGRKRLALVVDTTQTLAANRVTLYVDGVSVGAPTATPSANATLNLATLVQPSLAITNHYYQAIRGTLSYAAIYSVALTPAEISQNSQRLDISDDSPLLPATALGWTTASPSVVTAVTAQWNRSTSPGIAVQEIQYFSDASCSASTTSAIPLPSATQESHGFALGSLGTNYFFRITSQDSLGSRRHSACSSAMTLGTPPPLIQGASVLARYFFDEASSGSSTYQARDYGPSRVPLEFRYNDPSTLRYYAGPTGRGIEYITTFSGPQRASAHLNATPLYSALNGATAFSIEQVLDLSHCELANEGSRLITINDPALGYDERLQLRCHGDNLSLVLAGTGVIIPFSYRIMGAGRRVVTLTYDTTRPHSKDWLMLYVDGALIASHPRAGGQFISNYALTFSGNQILSVGNRWWNAVRGKIGYTALYNRALTAQEVSDHAVRLLASDDSPVSPATNLGWIETAPSASLAVTATWSRSTSVGLANQKIQFFRDASCSASFGGEVDLGSASATSAPFTGNSGSTYYYQITSIDSQGHAALSPCSSGLPLQTIPTLGILASRIGQYFFSEATSGTSPTHALDSSTNPIDLPITYQGTSLVYTSTANGRGLHFLPGTGGRKPSVAITGTKFATELHGRNTFTIETLLDMSGCGTASQAGSIFSIGDLVSGNHGRIGLRCNAKILEFYINHALVASWSYDSALLGRHALTVVFNASNPSSTRALLYLDGALRASSLEVAPTSTTSSLVPASDLFMIGNRSSTNINGRIYSFAVYNNALTSTQVSDHAFRLLANDD